MNKKTLNQVIRGFAIIRKALYDEILKVKIFQTHKISSSKLRSEADELWSMIHKNNPHASVDVGKKTSPWVIKAQAFKVAALAVQFCVDLNDIKPETVWDKQPLGKVSDAKIARKLLVNKETVRRKRIDRGIPPFKPERMPR